MATAATAAAATTKVQVLENSLMAMFLAVRAKNGFNDCSVKCTLTGQVLIYRYFEIYCLESKYNNIGASSQYIRQH